MARTSKRVSSFSSSSSSASSTSSGYSSPTSQTSSAFSSCHSSPAQTPQPLGSSRAPSPLVAIIRDACASATRAAFSASPEHASTRRRKGHVPRPQNAFMLFRNALCPALRERIEHDHRHISRIIGHAWNALPGADRAVWFERAHAVKAEHMRRYPNYHFTPVVRKEKPKKRNVKRNGAADIGRCRKVAELLLEGKAGDELETEVRRIDQRMYDEQAAHAQRESAASGGMGSSTSVFDLKLWGIEGCATATTSQDTTDVPPLRGPLLSPVDAKYPVPSTPSPLMLASELSNIPMMNLPDPLFSTFSGAAASQEERNLGFGSPSGPDATLDAGPFFAQPETYGFENMSLNSVGDSTGPSSSSCSGGSLVDYMLGITTAGDWAIQDTTHASYEMALSECPSASSAAPADGLRIGEPAAEGMGFVAYDDLLSTDVGFPLPDTSLFGFDFFAEYASVPALEDMSTWNFE